MQRSRLPLTLALVAFALSLLSGIHLYKQVLQTVPALVILQDAPPGAEITPAMVEVRRVPAGGRPEQALYGPGQISGRYASIPLFEGQILTERHVSATPPLPDPLLSLSAGQRIISVPVRSEAALGGAMRPGDLVDVVAAWPGEPGKAGPVEVVATGVKVVDLRNGAGGSTAAAGDETRPESAVPTSVLLQVNSQQARSLVAAVEAKASIYLWLSARGGAR